MCMVVLGAEGHAGRETTCLLMMVGGVEWRKGSGWYGEEGDTEAKGRPGVVSCNRYRDKGND